MALGRQRPALDRVGEDDARAVADRVGLAVAVEQAREVVAAEVAERGQQVGVVEVVDVDLEPLAQLAARRRAAAAGTPRWASRRCGRAASGRRCRRGPYLTITVCQPAASNIAARRPAAMSGTTRSSDWRLRSTTHITSPEARDHRVGDRLPARALVELGVADQRDLAAAARDVEVAGDVAVRERAPDRRGGAEADASRSSSRPGRGPSCGSGRTAARRTRAASSGSARSSRPSRWLIACRTGLACGFTLTRSGASSTREPQRGHQRHHARAARPGGRRPSRRERFSRTRLAWWTMLVASHSTPLLDALERLEVDLGGDRHGAEAIR